MLLHLHDPRVKFRVSLPARQLKAAGIDRVIIFCTSDTRVMDAWGEAQGIAGTNITFMGDPNSVMVENLGVELTHLWTVLKHKQEKWRLYIFAGDGQDIPHRGKSD